ncbi:MAG: flagellar basal body protein FliL [Rhodobacterales bacterium]|nr:MAG: flagellar basal body protein FliL [Rhodobacterales bacterium]
MAESEEQVGEEGEETPKKKSKLPLILGVVLALAGGGGGFFAVYSGMLFGEESHEEEMADEEHPVSDMPDIAFVAVDPMVISLRDTGPGRHLRFRAQLEVPSKHQSDVETLLPRVVDVLNSYLRALELADIQDAAALVRLRAQMLRRVQIVTGSGRVNDLLIMEFVVN